MKTRSLYTVKDLMIQVHPQPGRIQQTCEINGCTQASGSPPCYNNTCQLSNPPAPCNDNTYYCGATVHHCGCTYDSTPICQPTYINPCRCTLHPTILKPCEVFGPTFQPEGFVEQDPMTSSTKLSALKEQLKQQLAAIEEHERTTAESLKPQTVAEVDELQGKLEAAIEELKTRRTELETTEKQSKKGPQGRKKAER
jgi:hypothetical protein